MNCFKGNDTKKAIRLKKLSDETLNQDKANEDVSEKNTAVASSAKDRVIHIFHFGFECLVQKTDMNCFELSTSFICSGSR